MGFSQYSLQMATKEIGKIDRERDNQQIRQDKNNFCYKIFHAAAALANIETILAKNQLFLVDSFFHQWGCMLILSMAA